MAKAQYDRPQKRLFVLLAVIALFFFVLVGGLAYNMLIVGPERQEMASGQWTRQFSVTAKRGAILDKNGQVLAQSVSAVQIVVEPKKVKSEENAQKIADLLASYLDCDAATLKEKMLRTDRSQMVLARQVRLETSDQIQAAMKEAKLTGNGIYYLEDTIRAYPLGDFLCQVIGYCDVSGQGQSGLEQMLDTYLKGEDGYLVSEIDGGARELPYGTSSYVAPVNGYTVNLTVDYVIQSIVESAAETALAETGGQSVQCIVMNPKTGAVLAMYNGPDFDLNNVPRDDLSTLYDLSRNRCVTDAYEPGSVFKVVTLSSALDTGAVTLDSTFYCDGYITVDGDRIKCWNTAHPHGSQNLTQATMNSCNPAFVTIALKLGKVNFYTYLDRFGFGTKTGITLAGESAGQVIAEKYIKNTDLARIGFGQSIAVTPLQMLSAACAAVNDGIRMQPYIVSSIADEEGNDIVVNAPTELGQVISAQTSATVRDILQKVVEEGGGRNAYIEGYRVAGKTGTAQKYENGKIKQDAHICSFLGIAPIDDPQIAVLFIVDEPTIRPDYGSTVAAPYARDILEESLKYLGVQPVYENEEQKETANQTVSVPYCIGLSAEDAQKLLEDNGFYALIEGSGTVSEQSPVYQTQARRGSIVALTLTGGEDPETTELGTNGLPLVVVPDVSGMSVIQANRALRAVGLEMKMIGSGTAVSQDVEAGKKIETGQTVKVTFQ